MGNTVKPMALAILILVIWVAIGVLVIGLLNLAKWTMRSPRRLTRVYAGNARTWPALRPVSKLESTATVAMQQARSRGRESRLRTFRPR